MAPCYRQPSWSALYPNPGRLWFAAGKSLSKKISGRLRNCGVSKSMGQVQANTLSNNLEIVNFTHCLPCLLNNVIIYFQRCMPARFQPIFLQAPLLCQGHGNPSPRTTRTSGLLCWAWKASCIATSSIEFAALDPSHHHVQRSLGLTEGYLRRFSQH